MEKRRGADEGVNSFINEIALCAMKSKADAFGEIFANGSGEMKSVLNPAKQDFTMK